MKKYFKLLAFFSLITFYSIAFGDSEKGNLKIYVKGFENNNGKARILLFEKRNKKYFPDNASKAYMKFERKIINKSIILEIKDIPYGKYAVSVHHDENNDDELNTNFLGVPAEGIGASNDAEGSFGPPEFEDAAFLLNKKLLSITINMKY